jgi:SnoaL-like domain
MGAMDVAQRYFGAWNRRDAAELIAMFADGGTYRDPATGQLFSGPAIAAYASGLWAHGELRPINGYVPVR